MHAVRPSGRRLFSCGGTIKVDTTTPNRSMYPSRRSRGSNLTCVQDPADTTRPGAVLTGQDRVIFHPDRGNVHFRMRKGEGGGEEQWRKWHARPHRQTDGPAGNCIARIGRAHGIVPLSISFHRRPPSSVRSSVVPRPRVRAPMSSFLPTYDRQPATCPCVSCPPVPVRSSSIRSPSTRRFTLPREAERQRLFPENGSQIDGRMEFPGNE